MRGEASHKTDDLGFLTTDDLERVLQLSAWTISRMVKQGRLPPPIKLSDCTLRWRVGVIRRWQDDQQRRAEEEHQARLRKRQAKPKVRRELLQTA